MVKISHGIDENDSQSSVSFSSDEMEFWQRVVAVYMGVLPDLERALQDAGKVSFFEFQVLDHLAKEDAAVGMSHLAARCNASLSRLSHVARKLDQRGLMVRRLSDTDKRVTVAEITDEGSALLEDLRGVYHDAVETRVLQSLTPEELRQATSIFDNVLRRNQPDHWLLTG